MGKCPVCGKNNEELLCTECGFDGSRDREAFPTFGKCAAGARSVSGLREERDGSVKDRLNCPACGGFRFFYDLREGSFVCTACRASLSDAQVRAMRDVRFPVLPTEPVKLRKPSAPEHGSVIAAGGKQKGQSDVSHWQDVTAVAAGWFYSVGLKKDGTVLSAGLQPSQKWNVDGWKGIKAIAAGAEHVVGLRADGTVVTAEKFGKGYGTRDWSGITAVAAGVTHTLGLEKDGHVVSTGSLEGDWTNMVAIAAGDGFSVGLRKDGTVYTCGSNAIRSATLLWRGVTAIAAGDRHVVGLLADGSVVTTEPDSPVSRWRNVVAIAAGGRNTLGLRADGTVLSSDPYLDVSEWKNIKAIAVGRTHGVGLRSQA